MVVLVYEKSNSFISRWTNVTRYLAQFLVWFVMLVKYMCNFIYDIYVVLKHYTTNIPGNYNTLPVPVALRSKA